MSIQKLKNVGIRFVYSEYSAVPEIPSVQDVLFALGLSAQEENYSFCQGNHEPYIDNIQLVVDRVGAQVKAAWPDEAKARKIIAKAIIALCPPEAKCLFNTAFVKAKIMAGYENWEVALGRDGELLRKTCLCPHCQPAIEERQITA